MTLVAFDSGSSGCVINISFCGCGLGTFGNFGDSLGFVLVKGFTSPILAGSSTLGDWNSLLVLFYVLKIRSPDRTLN